MNSPSGNLLRLRGWNVNFCLCLCYLFFEWPRKKYSQKYPHPKINSKDKSSKYQYIQTKLFSTISVGGFSTEK